MNKHSLSIIIIIVVRVKRWNSCTKKHLIKLQIATVHFDLIRKFLGLLSVILSKYVSHIY